MDKSWQCHKLAGVTSVLNLPQVRPGESVRRCRFGTYHPACQLGSVADMRAKGCVQRGRSVRSCYGVGTRGGRRRTAQRPALRTLIPQAETASAAVATKPGADVSPAAAALDHDQSDAASAAAGINGSAETARVAPAADGTEAMPHEASEPGAPSTDGVIEGDITSVDRPDAPEPELATPLVTDDPAPSSSRAEPVPSTSAPGAVASGGAAAGNAAQPSVAHPVDGVKVVVEPPAPAAAQAQAAPAPPQPPSSAPSSSGRPAAAAAAAASAPAGAPATRAGAPAKGEASRPDASQSKAAAAAPAAEGSAQRPASGAQAPAQGRAGTGASGVVTRDQVPFKTGDTVLGKVRWSNHRGARIAIQGFDLVDGCARANSSQSNPWGLKMLQSASSMNASLRRVHIVCCSRLPLFCRSPQVHVQTPAPYCTT